MTDIDTASADYRKTLVVAAILGVVVAVGSLLFTSAEHALTEVVWDDIPDGFGWHSPHWWYVLGVTTLGGVLVALAIRLPGGGGHSAAAGLSVVPAPPLHLPGIVLAALAALVCGIVVGPEAPLIAIGLTFGAVATILSKTPPAYASLVVLAGAFAALSSVFGSPIATLVLMLEMAAAGGLVKSSSLGAALVPGLIAAGTGTLIYTGVGDWQGVHQYTLEGPTLPDYPTVRLVDVGWCMLLAALTAGLLTVMRDLSLRMLKGWKRIGLVLIAAGLAIGLTAVIFDAITSRGTQIVLFSGQTSLGQEVAEGSAGVMVALIAAKALAYFLSLAAGFRGGPIFPALFIGVAVGVLGSIVLPGLALTPAVASGMAAGATGVLRLPFLGIVLSVVLLSGNSFDVIVVVILAGVVAWLVAREIDSRLAPAPEPAPAS